MLFLLEFLVFLLMFMSVFLSRFFQSSLFGFLCLSLFSFSLLSHGFGTASDCTLRPSFACGHEFITVSEADDVKVIDMLGGTL